MGARVVSTRLIGTALVVLCCLSASGSPADDAIARDLGPIRQWVAQRGGVLGTSAGPFGPVTPLRIARRGRSHAQEGAILGAVALGVMGGGHGYVVGAFGCDAHPDEGCRNEALLFAAAGAAGGALIGGAVGGLVGSLLQTSPSAPPLPPPARTRVAIVPRRGGIGIALSHSF